MGSRVELNRLLLTLCSYVYFQPPESIKLNYPCIVYNLTSGDHKYANDKTYVFKRCYDISIISRNPDDPLIDTLAYALPMCRITQSFVSDNLYHTIFRVFY